MNWEDIETGSLVQVKGLYWYNTHKDWAGVIPFPSVHFTKGMCIYCGKVIEAHTVDPDNTIHNKKTRLWFPCAALEPVNNKTLIKVHGYKW